MAGGWVATAGVDGVVATTTGEDGSWVMEGLAARGNEARPAWKPMHAQPVFSGHESLLTGVADEIFDRGLCLPSGSSLTVDDQQQVIDEIRRIVEGA